LKLRADDSLASKDRLEAWLTMGNGDIGEYSIKGANDAVSYYDEAQGDMSKLRLSYDWPWLMTRFNK
jgi:hypothetical protein